MPRFQALCRHWSAHPPLARLIAAALGYRGGRTAAAQSFATFFRAMTGASPPA